MRIKMDKKTLAIGILGILLTVVLAKAAIPDTLAFKIENSTGTIFTVDKLGHVNATGNIQTNLDLYVGGTIIAGADKLSETVIDFNTVCASGNHLYVSGNDLACEPDDVGGNTSAEVIAAVNQTDYYYQIAVKDLTCANCIGGTEILESSLVGVPTYNATYDAFEDTANTTEEMQDAVMAGIDDGTQTGITVTYQDATNDMDFVVTDSYVNTVGDTMTGVLQMDPAANISISNSSATIVKAQNTGTYFYFDSAGALVIHLAA